MIERIKKIMELMQLSPANFADAIHINRSNITHLLTGRNQPSLDLARKILLTFPEISTEWLIMGVGKMMPEEKSIAESETEIKSGGDVKLERKKTDSTIGDLFSGDDLFSQQAKDEKQKKELPIIEKEVPKQKPIIERELKNVEGSTTMPQIFDSREDKEIKKIVILFTDNTFECYKPNERNNLQKL